jgi:hypothetical protein
MGPILILLTNGGNTAACPLPKPIPEAGDVLFTRRTSMRTLKNSALRPRPGEFAVTPLAAYSAACFYGIAARRKPGYVLILIVRLLTSYRLARDRNFAPIDAPF